MNYIYVGKFWGTHALKGEIKFNSNFKYLEKILQEGFKYYIGDEKNEEVLIKYRFHKNNYLMTFKNLEDINKIEKYINKKVYINKEDLNLKKNELLLEDYIDLNCYFNDKKIGTILDINDAGNGNYIFIIKGKEEILIPFNNNFIKEVTNDKIYFKNLEGFINEN